MSAREAAAAAIAKSMNRPAQFSAALAIVDNLDGEQLARVRERIDHRLADLELRQVDGVSLVAPPDVDDLADRMRRWFTDVSRLRDPAAADRLLRAAWAHLAATRPEAPCNLSTLEPTEPVPTAPPGGAM